MSIITGLTKSVRSRMGTGKAAVAELQPELVDMPHEPVILATVMSTSHTDVEVFEQGLVAGTAKALASLETAKRRGQSPKAAASSAFTKAEQVLSLLRAADGATLAEMTNATGWQAHSVRGFLSATVRKKLGLDLVSNTDEAGVRRYRIASPGDGTGEGPESSSSVAEGDASAQSNGVAAAAQVN